MSNGKDKSKTYVRRMVIGSRMNVDVMCRKCMSIVLDVAVGCAHCGRLRERSLGSLAAFLAERKAQEGGAL